MLEIPFECPRGRKDCIALSNIVSGCGKSFFCCGEHNGEKVDVPEDKYRLCFKGPFNDTMTDNDKRDLVHNSAVMVRALAVIQADYSDDKDWSPWDESSEIIKPKDNK